MGYKLVLLAGAIFTIGCQHMGRSEWSSIYEGCSRVFETYQNDTATHIVVYPPIYEERWFKVCDKGECKPPVPRKVITTPARTEEIIVPITDRESSKTGQGWDCDGQAEYDSIQSFYGLDAERASWPKTINEGVTFIEVDMK